MHGKDGLVADGDDAPAGFFRRLQGLLAAGRFPDADGRRHRLGVFHGMPQHQRGRPLRLHPQDVRQSRSVQVFVLAETGPIGGDVPRVAHRQAQPIGGVPQRVANLEGRRFLPLDAVGIDGVDQRDGVAVGDFHHHRQGVVEGAFDLHYLRAVGHRSGQFSGGHLPLGDEYHRLEAGAGCVGRRRGRRIPRGGANHGLRPASQRFADRGGHPAVFEGAGGVQSFEFDVQFKAAAQVFGQPRHGDEPRLALQQSDRAGVGGQIQQMPVTMQDAEVGMGGILVHDGSGWVNR